MKRTLRLQVLAFAMAVSAASTAQACCFFPFALLNPFTWGCGCGAPSGCGYGGYGAGGCGYGYGGYGYGSGYGGYGSGAPYAGGFGIGIGVGFSPPVYRQPMYAPVYGQGPMQSGCNECAAAYQPPMSGMQVPVTNYQAVNQYMPQTSYQAPYGWSQPSVAYGNGFPAPGSYAAPQTYSAPTQIGAGYGPTYVVPQEMAPTIATPIPAGDISGDHEYPATSGLMPVPQSAFRRGTPIQPASYRVTPRTAHRYTQSVR